MIYFTLKSNFIITIKNNPKDNESIIEPNIINILDEKINPPVSANVPKVKFICTTFAKKFDFLAKIL